MNARSDRAAAEQAALRAKDRRTLLIAALILVLVVVGAGVGFQFWRTHRAPEAAAAAVGQGFAPVTIEPNRPIVLGKPGAPVTLTLYEDFKCPHCAEFFSEFQPVIAEAQAAGTVQVELWPMAFVAPASSPASNAMAAAAEAGFGQAYYDGLFSNPDLPWSDQQLIELAEGIGAKPDDAFRNAVTSRQHAAWVESINTTSRAAGVRGTPTILLDGTPLAFDTLTPESLRDQIAAAAG